MNPNIKDAIVAAFVADALSLGVHWVYDTAAIDKKYGRLETMVNPQLAPYHKSKQKGEFTHYGDQALLLLESITQKSGFDLTHFSDMWQAMFHSYGGYVDSATKETMDNFKSGKGPEASGSLSSDLAGASRLAPLALFYGKDEDTFASKAKLQTIMTHNHEQVIACAEFFARTFSMVLEGKSPMQAFQKALDLMPDSSQIQPLIKAGLETSSDETRQTIERFGQMCSVQAALPSTIHLIAKYEDDLKEALIENIMSGGDSSAREMITGFIIGGYKGLGEIPDKWLNDMTAYKKIVHLMHQD